jgi:hypothetical protein
MRSSPDCWVQPVILWPKLFNLPFCFSTWLENRCVVPRFPLEIQLKWSQDVPVPTDFGLSYDNLDLNTPDGITLRSYLLRQRKELGHHQDGHVETSESQTDEEVSGDVHAIIYAQLRLLIPCLVFGNTTYCTHVSWERWKPWTSYTSRQGVLYQNEMQRAYAFVSRVSTQFLNSNT